MSASGLTEITVIKLNTLREETWRYPGKVLGQTGDSLLLEAFFNRPDRPFHGIVMRKGDRFLEKYFFDRWYNIYEIHDRDDDHIKAWYCNVSRPAEMTGDRISYVDLALDLLVYPNGEQLVLDQDEFTALDLEEGVRLKATAALEELQLQFSNAANYKLS